MRPKIALAALLTLPLVAAVWAPAPASAKVGGSPAFGVSPPGSPYRYVAISPGHPGKLTIVERIARNGGRVNGWWTLRGELNLPPLTFNGSGTGVSADGGTLVLSRFSAIYPPRRTELAILDTRVHPRHPHRTGKLAARPVATRVKLTGSYTFHAISPHGSAIYLERHLSPYVEGPFEVREMRDGGGRRPSPPLRLPRLERGRMAGAPLDQAIGSNGRWSYTLYGGKRVEPFVYALDTVHARANRVDLPRIHFAHDYQRFELALRMGAGGRSVEVLNRRPTLPGSRPLFAVDAKTFAVAKAPGREEAGGVAPRWLPIVLGTFALALVAWRGIGRRRSTRDGS